MLNLFYTFGCCRCTSCRSISNVVVPPFERAKKNQTYRNLHNATCARIWNLIERIKHAIFVVVVQKCHFFDVWLFFHAAPDAFVKTKLEMVCFAIIMECKSILIKFYVESVGFFLHLTHIRWLNRMYSCAKWMFQRFRSHKKPKPLHSIPNGAVFNVCCCIVWK